MGLKLEVIEKFAGLITGAFGLVAALAWNSAIQKWFENQAWLSQGGPWIYALFVTIIVIIATYWISYLANKAKEREKNNSKAKK